MAAFTFYQPFKEKLVEGINCGSDTWRVILSNTAPDLTDSVQADAAEIANGNGYTTNGNACAVSSSTQSSGTYKLVLADPTAWTATGAGFTFRYAILWNQTIDALAGWWDYGSSQAVAAGESIAVDLDGTAGVFQVS